jgi:hypothetical protein
VPGVELDLGLRGNQVAIRFRLGKAKGGGSKTVKFNAEVRAPAPKAEVKAEVKVEPVPVVIPDCFSKELVVV